MKRYLVNTPSCNEDEILRCCARVSLSPETRGRLEQLVCRSVDWQMVLQRSWWHRIRPLVYRHLSTFRSELVPAAFLRVLGDHASELADRNRNLLKMQQFVSNLLERESVPTLVFKGPTLAADAYGDLSLRECGDLDMLIHRDHFPRARAILTRNDFACLWDHDGRERQVFACEFQRDGVELDLHWDLAPGWHNYNIDFDHLWGRGQMFAADSRLARKLAPEDALQVLCMHGTKHWWERLRWICDIAELVENTRQIDWDLVEAAARKARCQRSVWLGLCLARDLLGAELPPAMQRNLDRSTAVQRLAAQVAVWLGYAEHATESRRLPQRFLFRMRLCERPRDRLWQLAYYLLAWPSRRVGSNP